MLTNNDLAFLSGNYLPFPEAGLNIYQPKIKEIAFIGEEAFYTGLELLNFSKNNLTEEDKVNLDGMTNFDVLIAILKERNAVMQKNRNCVMMVLALIFPEYKITLEDGIVLKNTNEEVFKIDNSNFEKFKDILNTMFMFKQEKEKEYNPVGELSKRIADKLKKRQQKLNETKSQKKIDILSRYVSILATSQSIDINILLNYTVYQLQDVFVRTQLKMGYDIYLQAKMAGAKDLKEVEDWMKDIHQ